MALAYPNRNNDDGKNFPFFLIFPDLKEIISEDYVSEEITDQPGDDGRTQLQLSQDAAQAIRNVESQSDAFWMKLGGGYFNSMNSLPRSRRFHQNDKKQKILLAFWIRQ